MLNTVSGIRQAGTANAHELTIVFHWRSCRSIFSFLCVLRIAVCPVGHCVVYPDLISGF